MNTNRQRGNDPGPTSATVAENVRILRFRLRLTRKALAARLEKVGRPIPEMSLAKLESTTRRVDVDDLVALAEALGTTPALLLTPAYPTQEQEAHHD